MIPDKTFRKVFQGTRDDLVSYYDNHFVEEITEFFDPIEQLEIGKQFEHLFREHIIYRKEENIYVIFEKDYEAWAKKYNISTKLPKHIKYNPKPDK